MGELDGLIAKLDARRIKRREQTLADTSPIPTGADSALMRQVSGVFSELVVTPSLSHSSEQIRAIPDLDVQRRAKLIKKWVNETYNAYVKDNEHYPRWSHGEFENDVLAKFDKGFKYFAQVASINDVMRLRKEPRTLTRITDGKQRKIIEHDRRKPIEVITDEYTSNGNDPIQSYTVELLSVFSVLFFKLLKEGLKRETPKADLLPMLERTYGISEELFAYEHDPPAPFNLDRRTVTHVCRQYPAQALKRLDAYARLGKTLITKYWGDPTPDAQTLGNKQWVTSPTMIRNLILQHPDTVERGLEIVDASLESIVDDFPKIPRDVIISACAKFGSGFAEELENIDENVKEALDLYVCTDLTCDPRATRRNDHVFRYLQVEARLYQLISRNRTGYVDILRKAHEQYALTLENAQASGVALSFRAKRRVMQLLFGGNEANTGRIIVQERERIRKEDRLLGRLQTAAENADPVWGVDYLIWGAGDTVAEKLASGEERIRTILLSYYGSNYVEGLLQHQSGVLSSYIDAGFPSPSPELDQLKECLLISPHAARTYYDELSERSHLAWPKGIEQIPYDSSWENDLEGEENNVGAQA